MDEKELQLIKKIKNELYSSVESHIETSKSRRTRQDIILFSSFATLLSSERLGELTIRLNKLTIILGILAGVNILLLLFIIFYH